MRAVLLILLVAATTACAVAPVCAVTHDAAVDAAAPTDAFAFTDTAIPIRDGCTAVSTGILSIDRIFGISDQDTMLECGHIGRIRIFDHATGALVHDTETLHDYRCPPGNIVLAPGEYDLTADDPLNPQWSTGSAILHPELCPAGGPSGAFCPAQRVTVIGCASHGVMLNLYCDPRVGECPTPAFPWTAP